jgi:L-rhamnose mutarotase
MNDSNQIQSEVAALYPMGGDGAETEAGSVLAFNQFGSQRKSEFIRLAIEFWPNMSAICKAVGVARSTVYLHRKSDPAFNKALQEIDAMVCDEMEQTLRTEGMKPKGFLDRMAYLRAHRPELYDRAKVVKIEGYKMGDGERRQRLAGLEGAIDAEVVKTYQDRKQRQETKRIRADEERKRLGAGDGGGETA